LRKSNLLKSNQKKSFKKWNLDCKSKEKQNFKPKEKRTQKY
jgi:hypothetical protein